MTYKASYESIIPTFLLDSEVTPPCAEADPDAFFPRDDFDAVDAGMRAPVTYDNERAAKAICEECPMKVDCLIFAMKTGQQGIWGGTTESERKKMRRKYYAASQY